MLRRAVFVLAIASAGFVPLACGSGGGAPGAASPAGFQALRSQRSIPFANGLSAINYSLTEHKVDTFRDRIFAKPTASTTTLDYCYDLYFGYRRDGRSAWLTSSLEASASYLPGTGIVKVVQRPVGSGLRIETYYFSPMTAGAGPSVVALVRAVNEGAAALDCSVFSLMNFKLGGESDATQEWAFFADPTAGDGFGPYVMEGKSASGNRFVYKPIGTTPTHSSYALAGPSSPFARVAAGEHLVDPTASLNGDDIACGFEWQINGGGTFAAGAEAWAGFMVAFTSTGDETALKSVAKTFAAGKTPQEVLQREQDFWTAWHALEPVPPGIRADELALLQQSATVIKMAQCREAAPAGGQILASLPPGQWNMCWPRDASYAIAGLTRMGHHAEAKDGLAFMLNGTGDQYRAQAGLSKKYRISLCRYYGNGVEESDDNGNGFNIEFDDWGLFLWALAEYVERSNDQAFLATHYAVVRDEIADLLVSVIEPTSGLIKADSSIWERHLSTVPGTPDGAKHFAYTSINAANGLARAAALATRMGDATKAAAWTAAAQQISDAIRTNLSLADGAIASSTEEKAAGLDACVDASAVEAINHGVIAGTSPAAAATLALLDRSLRAWPLRSPGFLRNDDAKSYTSGNWYDRQEWVVIDLRIASALVRMGRGARARELLDWVLLQAGANFHLIPELYEESSSAYEGAVPMAGFGGGAFILATWDYYTQPPT